MNNLEPFDSCVYILVSTRDLSVIKYIGITCEKPQRRLIRHRSDSRRRLTRKDRWIAKELSEGFDIIIETILTSLQYSHVLKVEIGLIKEAREIGIPITNTTDGGDGTRMKQTLEHIEKRASQRRGKKMSKEYSLYCIKRNKGRKASDATKLKLSLALKGRKITDSHRFKLSESAKGKKMSESSKSGLLKANTGRIKTPNEIAKRLKHIYIPVVQIMDDNSERRWDSASHVEKEIKVSARSISAVCKGKRKTAGGFKWIYDTSKQNAT